MPLRAGGAVPHQRFSGSNSSLHDSFYTLAAFIQRVQEHAPIHHCVITGYNRNERGSSHSLGLFATQISCEVRRESKSAASYKLKLISTRYFYSVFMKLES